MATFFDKGRERAKHIVERVTKATQPRERSHSVSGDTTSPASSSQLPTASKKAYGFTAFKRALDDTDTLLLRDSSMKDAYRGRHSDQGEASTADATANPRQQGPLTAGMGAWDMPLTSFGKTHKPKARSLDMNTSPLGTAGYDITAVPLTPIPSTTAVDDASAAESGTSTMAEGTEPAAYTSAGPADRAITAEPVSVSMAADAAAAVGTTAAPMHAAATTTAAAVSAPSDDTVSSTPSSSTGAETEAVEAAPEPAHTADLLAASSSSSTAPATSPPPRASSAPADAIAAATVHASPLPGTSRPGVKDAANLIAPGLVARRRQAAIAAVETKDGPSPELQASPVIETEGAGAKTAEKTGSRVKLSAW